MFPRLYDSTETTFADNGIGILSGCLWCEVEEKSDSSYELQFEYPTEGENAVHWQDIQRRSVIRCRPTPKDSIQTFRVYSIKKKMNGNLLVKAAHWSYDLSDYIVNPFDAYSAVTAMTKLASYCIKPTGFTFWTDVTSSGEVHITKPISVRAALEKIQNAFGGEFEWDNQTVRLHSSRGADRGVTISYGKNLIDFNQEEKFDQMYTGLLPYWVDSQTGDVMELTQPIVEVDGTFDFERVLPYDFSSHYDEKPTEQQLQSSAEYHIEKYRIWEPQISMSVKFEQLEQMDEYKNQALLERVSLYDTVAVKFPKFGGISVKASVVDVISDVINERISQVTLGQYRKDIADTIAGTSKMIQERIDEAMAKTSRIVQEAVDNATDWITNGEGNVVIKKNASGQAVEILIMDTADITTATKVWRWNSGGLGYSSNGYAGPYTTAITQDGAIVANFITAGVLSGDLIRTGALTSIDGDAIFDLDNESLRMNFDEDHYMTFDSAGLEYWAYGSLAGFVRFQPSGGVEGRFDMVTADWSVITPLVEVSPDPADVPQTGEPMRYANLSKNVDQENDVYLQMPEGRMHGFTSGSVNITSSWTTVYYRSSLDPFYSYDVFYNVPIILANYETEASSGLSGDLPSILIRSVNKRSFQICYGGSGSTQRPVKWVALDIEPY